MQSIELPLIALAGVVLGALIAGVFGLWAKHSEYVNDYYKTVIQRRIAAYEQLESLIIDFKPAVYDTDREPYHLPFSGDKAKEKVFVQLFSVMSQGLWLSDEAFRKVRELNCLLFPMPDVECDAIKFGKTHWRAIAELREALEGILAADMMELHRVGRFLKRKKNRKGPGFETVQLGG